MAKIERKRARKSSFTSVLAPQEISSLKKAIEVLGFAKEKHGLSYEDVLGLLREEQEKIPVTIFNDELSPLESISRYLKDSLGLSYHEIAVLIGRDERNIWHSYSSSLKKHPEKLDAKETKFFIPLKIFAERRFSILESIAVHLKEEYNLSYREISSMIMRDERTVWTAYNRAAKKMKKSNPQSDPQNEQ